MAAEPVHRVGKCNLAHWIGECKGAAGTGVSEGARAGSEVKRRGGLDEAGAEGRIDLEDLVAHAVPVGSGTVARTKRIPIERRAEAATIAWLRHATTAYDTMQIARVKGMRREVRRLLAERSRQLLGCYRRGDAIAPESCLLTRGLQAR